MDNIISLDDDLDPALARVLRSAYALSVPPQTAARHLRALQAAARQPRRVLPDRLRRAATAAVACLAVLITAGAAVASSQQALPGEALYGVKTGAEQAQLLLLWDPVSEAELHLRFARRRLAEASLAQERDPDAVPALLRRASASIDKAEHLAPAALVAETAAVREELDDSAPGLKGAQAEVAADDHVGAPDAPSDGTSATAPLELGPPETSTAESARP